MIRSSRNEMVAKRVYHVEERKVCHKMEVQQTLQTYAFSPGEIRLAVTSGAQVIR